MTPITRKELYYAYLAGQDVQLPTPITRQEQFLYDQCMNMGLTVDENGVLE